MNRNAKPKSSSLPPLYPKSQSSILQPILILQPPTTSQSSFSYPANNQEACMYSSNSNSGLQPLHNVRNYKTQISVPNMHNRTVVTSQTSVERLTYTNVKGLQQPNHNLQTVSSGIMQNTWLNSAVRNSNPSHTEATGPQQPNFGTSIPYMHAPQNQLLTSDTYSVQLQMTPSNSVRGPVTFQGNHQGNQGLNHSVPDQLVDWAQQYTSNELTYPDYRPPPEYRPPLNQYSYSPQSFLQDPSVQKQSFMPSTLQIKNNEPPTSAQTSHSKHPASVSSHQYAGENSRRLPALPYSCRYGTQSMQNPQPVAKHLPVEVPQSSEMYSSEKRKDIYKGFQQRWQNTSENISTIGKFCELKINANVKQPHNEHVSSPKDGAQTLTQNNQEKRMYSYNPSANQVLDTNVTKEKLVRDIKSLVEMKRKFSELARKIKINKDLLMAAGCSKTANTYTESSQHSEFSTKEMAVAGDKPCSMELLATCLSLWKNQLPETTVENIPKSSEEKLCSVSRTNTTSTGSSNPANEVQVKSLFSVGGNSQTKMASLSQETVLSVAMPTYESSSVTLAKGTELQIAVVSPLILSDVKALPEKELVPEAVPETVYPVVKEDSVCSLQDQLAKSTALTAALNMDRGTVAGSGTSAKVSPSVQKEKLHKPTHSDPDTAGGSQGKRWPPGDEALPNPGDSTVGSGPMLQIESICSLAEGDVSYNSQIAEIFNSLPLRNEPQKLPLSDQEIISNQQEQVDHTTENKDFGSQKDECVQCTDVPHEVTAQPKPLQPPEPASCKDVEANRELPEPASCKDVEANRELLEESSLECAPEKESTTEDVCCSLPVIQQDSRPQETVCSSNSTHDPAVNEIHEDPSAPYLYDQLSELLKEFPYGIEAVRSCEGSVGREKIDRIPENQTGGETGHVSEDCTDQIKITILNTEQIKELFPEEDDQSCKLAEPEKKAIGEGRSSCESQASRGESYHPGMLDPEKDKIHCCALGWLSMVYEGVPQCQCNSEEEKGKDQVSSETNLRQGEKSCSPGITIFEINTVSGTPKSPLTHAAEKGDFPETLDKVNTSKTKENSSPREEQESTSQLLVECYSKDEKDASEVNQDSSPKMGQQISDISSKCDKANPLKSKTNKHLKFHIVSFPSEQAYVESQHKKHIPQRFGQGKALQKLLPDKDSSRRNVSLVQSTSPEKKKLKFKAGGSRLKYFEKRKTDHAIIPDVEIKKKKYEKQEQNKKVGDTLKLCNTVTNPNERASVKERAVSSAKSSDLKDGSSKSTRVITLEEYLQRRKNKQMMGSNTPQKMCVENMPCDCEHLRPSKHSAPSSWGKLMGAQNGSEETSKEPVQTLTSTGKNLKSHHSEESTTHNVSSNSKGKVDRKHPDKASIDKTKLEKRLSGVSNEVESSQMPPQAKQQRKLYLNRVAFKCTERESICLTKLDSASQKLSKDKEKSQEYMPKAKDATDKPSMLEFKLCPDMLLKNPSSVDKEDDPTSGPGKEQTPIQVSGIKSTKEDWLKCSPVRTKMPEPSHKIDHANSRLSKRSFSADEFETVQNPVKDSNAMFRTYKQMYLEKRSRSLGSSPVK